MRKGKLGCFLKRGVLTSSPCLRYLSSVLSEGKEGISEDIEGGKWGERGLPARVHLAPCVHLCLICRQSQAVMLLFTFYNRSPYILQSLWIEDITLSPQSIYSSFSSLQGFQWLSALRRKWSFTLACFLLTLNEEKIAQPSTSRLARLAGEEWWEV